MSSRALILCMVLAFVGCAGAEDDAGEASRDAAAGGSETLEFVPLDKALLPNGIIELTVRYRDPLRGAVQGVPVEFSLVGTAAGASLSPTRALTQGEDATATTTLRAGSTASELQVRARAGESAYATLTLSVRPALGTRISVGVRYTGAREVASYTVTSVQNMTCAQALGAGETGNSTFHLTAPDARASFDLGYDLTTALVGWGKDASGSKLVRGCSEFASKVIERADEAQAVVTLELQDIDLTLNAALDVEMEVNASTAVRRFTDASNRAVAAAVSPDYSMFADADYLLDAVQDALTAQGNVAGAAALATRRTAEALAASLQPALTAQRAGPTAYGEATGRELARRGATLFVRWTLGAPSLSGLTAQSPDGSRTLSFESVPPASIITRFAPETAQLAIDQLRVQLGLGAYGKTLLAALDKDSRAAGCASVFAPWWSKSLLTDVVAAADAQAICVASLGQLDGVIEAELVKLDTDSTALTFAGAVPVHAREVEGVVNDLGPGELLGSWGADPLQAALQSPQRTAFQ